MNDKTTQAEREKLLENTLLKHGYNAEAIKEIKRLAFVDKLPAPKPAPEEK